MRWDILEEVAKAIEAAELPLGFNMVCLVGNIGTDRRLSGVESSCGTIGCIAGWTSLLFDEDGNRIPNEALLPTLKRLDMDRFVQVEADCNAANKAFQILLGENYGSAVIYGALYKLFYPSQNELKWLAPNRELSENELWKLIPRGHAVRVIRDFIKTRTVDWNER